MRTELARKIASFVGSAEKLITTNIPGLMLSRRTAPTAPASVAFEPSLAVVAQGRKRIDLGRTTFIFDQSRFLLTSLDLPVISQVIEARKELPYSVPRFAESDLPSSASAAAAHLCGRSFVS